MKVFRIFAWSAIAALVLASSAAGQTLIVLNKSDHEAALVDPDALTVIARIPTGRGPHEVAVSADGSVAYVTNYGSFAIFREGEQRRTEPGHTITVIDLKKREVKATWELGEYKQPHGIVASKDGSRVWVTTEGSQSVIEIATATGKIARAWKTNQEVSHMVVPSADEKKLYVASIRSGTVTIIQRETDDVRSIPTGDGAEGIALSPDGREVWVTNRGANTISVIDTARDAVVHTFESGGKMPIRVKFTPDGKRVWVSNAQSNSVSVFDTPTRARIASIEVGAVPVGIQMTPDGKRAFIANTNDNKVSLLDVPAMKLIKTFTTGTEPDGMAWSK